MANVKFGLNFAPLTSIVTVNSQDSQFPATNLFDYDHPLRPYKSTAATSGTYVRFQIASTLGIEGVLIRRTNASTILIRSSSNSTITTIDVNVVVGPVLDTRVNRYNYITTKKLTANAEDTMDSGYPYWEIMMSGATLDGGGSYFIGSVYLMKTVFQLNHDEQFPFTVRMQKGSVRADRINLSFKRTTFWSKVYITMPNVLAAQANSPDWTEGGEAQIWRIQNAADEGLIFWENRIRDNNELYSRVYHVIPSTDIQVAYSELDKAIEQTLEFEEVI